jgi:hypothetical protein
MISRTTCAAENPRKNYSWSDIGKTSEKSKAVERWQCEIAQIKEVSMTVGLITIARFTTHRNKKPGAS